MRPITYSEWICRCSLSSFKASGVQISEAVGHSKPGANTPTTVQDRPSRSTVVLVMSSRPPKSRCHRLWLNTSTRSFPSFSSLAENARPTANLAPRASKNCGETRDARIRSGSPSPVRLTAISR